MKLSYVWFHSWWRKLLAVSVMNCIGHRPLDALWQLLLDFEA